MAHACIFSSAAQGVYVHDAAVLPLFGMGSFLTLTKSVNPDQGRFGLFAIEIISEGGAQFTFRSAGIAEAYELFAVSPGMVIDPTFVTSTTPLISNSRVGLDSSLQTFFPGQSRYYGYWDDHYPPSLGDGKVDAQDNFGWVLITRTGSGLQADISATAVGNGIIVGTFTRIPEVSPSAFAILGLAVYLCRQRFGFRPVRCV